jgi:hypothetical protein
MNKSELDFLEKVFADQLNGRWRIYKSKMAKRMEADGFITVGGKVYGRDRFGLIRAEGHRLTVLGNFTYCTSERCAGPLDEDEEA